MTQNDITANYRSIAGLSLLRHTKARCEAKAWGTALWSREVGIWPIYLKQVMCIYLFSDVVSLERP
jgi:hypothetical protein